METKSYNKAGYQLPSDELHKRQQSIHTDIVVPAVIIAGVSDPVNIGTIFRIGDAVKCEKLVFVDVGNVDEQKLKRASRSTNTRVPFELVSSEQFAYSINDFQPLVAVEITSQSSDLYQTQLPEKGAFVIGGERYGIPAPILQLCTYAVHIPMFGINSSMNVATSLGIVLYEWHRRFRR